MSKNNNKEKRVLHKDKKFINIRTIDSKRNLISEIESGDLEEAKEYLKTIKNDIYFVIFNHDDVIILSGEIRNGKIKFIHESNGNKYGHYKDKDKDKDKDDDNDSYA